MAISSRWFTLALQSQFNGGAVNWTGDTIKVALIASPYNPSQDTDAFFSTPAANEITGTGYAAGGQALTGQSVGSIVGTHTIPLLAASSTWSNATFTCRYAVVYKATGTNSTSPLLGWVDFGGNQTVAAGTFVIAWDPTNGVLDVAAA